ncbi:MAG: DUF2480 family protein [Rhodothermales bacterium]|nr:DUF2480 family protein [Rhodothermales bacterium]
MEPIINRVAESDIEVFNLEDLWDGRPVEELDISQFLLEGLVLREKDFRESVKSYDWETFRDTHVAVTCSTDAIVPTWAYMLIASKLDGVASSTAVGDAEHLKRDFYTRSLEAFDWDKYRDSIVVVKGCGSDTVTENAYLQATARLRKVAKKIMYGEPCSFVPIWRRPSSRKPSTAGVAPAEVPPRSSGS